MMQYQVIKQWSFLCCLSLFALFTFTSCSPSVASIAGTRWQAKDKEEVVELEFFKDNTFTMGVRGVSIMSGKWIVLDDGRIKMEQTALGMTQTYFAKITGDKLNFNLNASAKLDFTKIK